MGHHNIRYDGDPYALKGVWSPPTSRANFCEEDYTVTFYIAEFINSISNIAYVFLALRHMYGPGSRGLLSPDVDFMSASLFVLGIGSFLFHASMRQTMEFVDELSMLLLMWSMLHTTLRARQSPTTRQVIAASLAVIFPSFAVFYVWSTRIIHQVIFFNLCLAVLTLHTMYVFSQLKPVIPEALLREWSVRRWKSIGFSVLGYILWNIDLEYCAQLRAIRAQVGLPWAWLLELHGWWHVLTAVGASMSMNLAREVNRITDGKKKD